MMHVLRTVGKRICIVAGLLIVLLVPAIAHETPPAQASYLTRMGYYVYYDDQSWITLQQHIDQLDIVAPYFFHYTPGGKIKELDEREAEVTEFVKSHNKKIIPIIQNEAKWDAFREQFEEEQARDELVEQLVELVESRGFDGIQIDFEAINADDDDLLTDIMRRISDEFRTRNLIISQAVVARVGDRKSQWGGAYDYPELAKLNDFVTVMAYDFTSSGSPEPGPVAPYWWVDEVLYYATQHFDPRQIYLGVPFYGRDWNLDDGPPAQSLSYTQTMERAERYDAVGGFSDGDRSPWLRYTDENGDEHEVWYENSFSLEAKLRLAQEYEVGGFAAWRIGHDDPDNWRVIGNLETPATAISPEEVDPLSMYFPETGHSLSGAFQDYWITNGGLMRFGFPRTEPFVEYDPMVGQSYTVQYFERARFELHPEFEGTENYVLLGHIGRWALEKRNIDPWATAVDPIPGREFFPETGHTLASPFLEYWQEHGGLRDLGFPITEPLVEHSEEDGGVYLVQYFERARMELHKHPETGEDMVLLGLLGNEMLRERGWIR